MSSTIKNLSKLKKALAEIDLDDLDKILEENKKIKQSADKYAELEAELTPSPDKLSKFLTLLEMAGTDIKGCEITFKDSFTHKDTTLKAGMAVMSTFGDLHVISFVAHNDEVIGVYVDLYNFFRTTKIKNIMPISSFLTSVNNYG
jgi:hypothetical protein